MVKSSFIPQFAHLVDVPSAEDEEMIRGVNGCRFWLKFVVEICRREAARVIVVKPAIPVHLLNLKGFSISFTLNLLAHSFGAKSASLFRTLKYRPQMPVKPFAGIHHARRWLTELVRWNNHDPRHSSIRFVTRAHCPWKRHTRCTGKASAHGHENDRFPATAPGSTWAFDRLLYQPPSTLSLSTPCGVALMASDEEMKR